MPTKLDTEAVKSHLQNLPGWSVNEQGEIAKEFNFPAYKDGLVFASAVGLLADKMDHHPDLLVGYRKVLVSVSTHSAGGLTTLDFELATKVESLLV